MKLNVSLRTNVISAVIAGAFRSGAHGVREPMTEWPEDTVVGGSAEVSRSDVEIRRVDEGIRGELVLRLASDRPLPKAFETLVQEFLELASLGIKNADAPGRADSGVVLRQSRATDRRATKTARIRTARQRGRDAGRVTPDSTAEIDDNQKHKGTRGDRCVDLASGDPEGPAAGQGRRARRRWSRAAAARGLPRVRMRCLAQHQHDDHDD